MDRRLRARPFPERSSALCLLAVIVALAFSPAAAASLSFDERVAAQRAIEEVYWHHRIWPEENPEPKPPLSAVLSDEAIRAKVADYLRKSTALATVWQRPITSTELQAEMDRLSRGTRDPAMLRELFAALGNDPERIAETLVRQTLVERLIRNGYAFDQRFHGELKRQAERELLAAGNSVAAMKLLGGEYAETAFVRRADKTYGVVELGAEKWEEWLEGLAGRFGAAPEAIPLLRPSRLEEDADGFSVTAVLSLADDAVSVATVVWPKRSFDAWWSAEREAMAMEVATAEPGSYAIAEPRGGGCADDTWERRYYAPGPRYSHTAVWTGTEMIVWGGHAGGDTSTGGRYDPATDSWMPTSTGANVPLGRYDHTAVWTGTRMIVWGGTRSSGASLNTGGRYDPATDSWTPTSTGAGVPSARYDHTAAWTGTEVIVWGGHVGSSSLNTGGRYDPAADTWTPTSTGANVPTARYIHTAVWTGVEMIVWGGSNDASPFFLNTGGRYDPATDIWTPTSTGANVPAARNSQTAVWTGTKMIVWGGRRAGNTWNTGGRYDPATDSWTPTSTGANVPTARYIHTAAWTGTAMIVWGGYFDTSPFFLNTGGRYDPATDTWTPTSTGANVPAVRRDHTVVWTGTAMIVWGGRAGSGSVFDTGGRYQPATDTWTPTFTGANVPAAGSGHTTVWTGTEMIVWGGHAGSYVNTGGRYDPATDAWTPTSIGANVPAARSSHTAVWTGTKMIVWGGSSGNYLDTGGRYDPATNTWMPTSGVNVPPRRDGHTAVWTGTRMIVWGGFNNLDLYLNTGGRYDPAADTWAPTSTGASVPAARTGHTAAWTGTKMIIWGGYAGNPTISYFNTGGRYDPASNEWKPSSVGVDVPAARYAHAAVWTGAEMVVWGGFGGSAMRTGGRYDPSADTWRPTSTGANVPAARFGHTAVWTGAELIVWGGYDDLTVTLDTGGLYYPAMDTWTPTSTGADVPAARRNARALWTGTQMIVWGGTPPTTELGLYCACTTIAYRDADGDGFGDAADSVVDCASPLGYAGNALDCDDAHAAVHPGAAEICDTLRNDCAGPGWPALLDTDTDLVEDACDNCVFDPNPDQGDLDADSEGDLCDLDDGLILIRFFQPEYVEWQEEAGFDSWNAYRGDLAILRATGAYTQGPGSNPLARQDCGLSDPSTQDFDSPPPGVAAFHLTTGVTGGVESSLGRDSAGVERANASPCP